MYYILFVVFPELAVLASGPTDLFLPNAACLFLMILILMAKGSPELARCYLWDVMLTIKLILLPILENCQIFTHVKKMLH
jgi:hypothetical protein